MLARADYIIRLMSYRRDDVVPVACRWDDARSVDMVSRTCSLAASAGLNYVEKRPASVAFAFFTYHERPTRGHSEVPKVSLPLTAKLVFPCGALCGGATVRSRGNRRLRLGRISLMSDGSRQREKRLTASMLDRATCPDKGLKHAVQTH